MTAVLCVSVKKKKKLSLSIIQSVIVFPLFKFIGCQTALFSNVISKRQYWNESHQGVTQSACLATSPSCQESDYFSLWEKDGYLFLICTCGPYRERNSISLTRQTIYVFINWGSFCCSPSPWNLGKSALKLIVCVCGRKPYAMKVIWYKSVIKKWPLHATYLLRLPPRW